MNIKIIQLIAFAIVYVSIIVKWLKALSESKERGDSLIHHDRFWPLVEVTAVALIAGWWIFLR